MEERAVVDRIVDDKRAVLLIGEHEHEAVVPVGMLPSEAGEGSRVVARLEVVGIELDSDADAAAGDRIDDKLDQLRSRGSRLEPESRTP